MKKNIKLDIYKKVLGKFPISKSFSNLNIIPIHSAVYKYYKDIGMITNNPDPRCAYFSGTGKCNLEILNPFLNTANLDYMSKKFND